MKITLNTLKTILRDNVKTEIAKRNIKNDKIITENIVSKMLAIILSPKIQKIADKYKNEPEYKELEIQAKRAADELELISKRLERLHKERESLSKEAKKMGIKYKPGMTRDEIVSLFPNIFKNS